MKADDFSNEELKRLNKEREAILRDRIENKILYYKPCCPEHTVWVDGLDENGEPGKVPVVECPVIPCNSKHWKFHMSEKKNRIVYGSNRCISGDTVIDGRKVKDIKGKFYVLSWDGEKLVKARAEAPFLKGRDHLYRYEFGNGANITCTRDHKIFNGKRYISAGSLSVGTTVLTPLSPPESISGNVPLIHVSSVSHLRKRVQDLIYRCFSYLRLYGERLPLSLNSVRYVSPLRGGVRGYTGHGVFPFFSYSDDSGSKRGYSRSYLLSGPLSNLDDLLRTVVRGVERLSHFFLWPLKRFAFSHLTDRQSNRGFYPLESKSAFGQPAKLFSSDSSSSFSEVISITYVGYGDYYDFEVPKYHNYYAGGLIHHNSGKSVMGCAEIIMMSALKRHMFRKTINPKNGAYRVYTEDFALLEKNIIPLFKEWLPIRSYKNVGGNAEESWEKSFDKKYHILRLKNATIDFMTYEQPLSKSESVSLNGVWGDEEMPEDVFIAVQARLISRNGRFWLTVTPLYKSGWTTWLKDGEDMEIYKIGMGENQYIPKQAFEDFKKSLERFSEEEQLARLHGHHMEFKGMVYKELDSEVHRIDPFVNEPVYPVIFVLDPHPRKPSMMAWAYVTPDDDVIFFDEMEVDGDARKVTRAIRERERLHRSQTLLRIIDPAARKQFGYGYETDTLQEFEREGMDFDLGDNSEAGYNVVHEYLAYDKSKPVGAFNRPKCFFTKDCTLIWDSMSHLLWDEWAHRNTMKDKKEKVKDFKKDGADCVRYVLAARPTFRSFSDLNGVRIGGEGKRLRSDIMRVIKINRGNEVIEKVI